MIGALLPGGGFEETRSSSAAAVVVSRGVMIGAISTARQADGEASSSCYGDGMAMACERATGPVMLHARIPGGYFFYIYVPARRLALLSNSAPRNYLQSFTKKKNADDDKLNMDPPTPCQ